jgi:ATP-dependent Lon protease
MAQETSRDQPSWTAENAPGDLAPVERRTYPDRLPILALPSRPVFPRVMVPVELEGQEVKELLREAKTKASNMVGLVLERVSADSNIQSIGEAKTNVEEGEVYDVGVVAQVVSVNASEEGITVVLSALDRMRIVRVIRHTPYLVAEVEYLYDKSAPSDELKAYTLAVINSVKDLVALNPLYKEQLSLLVSEGNLDDPGPLADTAAFLTSADGPQLQRVLETLDVRKRLERVLGLLKRELEISRLQATLREKIEERVDEQQREFFLREQLKVIKHELGIEKEGKETELEEFRARLGKRSPSAEARTRIEEELKKASMIEPSSPEYVIARNYLDWLTVLPWGVGSKADVTLEKARRVLDRDHYGLSDVKERIIEFIAEGILRRDFGGSIICLLGPPGVGKTSIGRSIAASLGRKFYRFSLGGMRDEAEIKGHRRTYIGAMPGKFLQALRVCETNNPVIMLDEIDKVGASYHGDPASALLEVLDPEQNREFLDHYLDVRFDLSKVLFVCTANQLDTIPAALLDRMEIIPLSGYLLEEKLEIARRFLLPKALRPLNLKRGQISVNRAALRELVDGYAREAGLRNLESQIKKLVRKSAVKVVEHPRRKISLGPRDIEPLLGQPMFTNEELFDKPAPGVAMGLAWTSMGGETLYVEARAINSRTSGLRQTGQLGKVMTESTEIAYTFVRGLCETDEKNAEFFSTHTIHLHVPAGATPKDGPSAGTTMAVALYSLATGRAVVPRIAMTGELNLSGMVMPVGGIKVKLLAAKRAKVRRVILPRANQADYSRLATSVKRGLPVDFVVTFAEVLELCFPRNASKRAGKIPPKTTPAARRKGKVRRA